MEYKTNGVCAQRIYFDIDEETKTVHNVKFDGGCDGNHKGIISLVEGQKAEDVIKKLEGITCGFRKTSCPDQLAQGLKQYLSK